MTWKTRITFPAKCLTAVSLVTLTCGGCYRENSQAPLRLSESRRFSEEDVVQATQLAAPPGRVVVKVVGRDFRWRFCYAGADQTLGTNDDFFSESDLCVPQDREVDLRLASEDYVYIFRVPELDLSQAAIPDLKLSLRFRPEKATSYDLPIDSMCGLRALHDNDSMGKLTVMTCDDFLTWWRAVQ